MKQRDNLGSGMVKPGEGYDMVKNGLIDGAYCVLAFGAPGQFPMIDVIALPYNVPTAVIGGRAMQAYYAKGYLDKELAGVHPVCFLTGQGDTLFTKKKAVTTLKDMKGMKVFAVSPIGGERIKLWGGIPVTIPMTDMYAAASKGIVDGIFINTNMLELFRLADVLRYRTMPQEGTVCSVFLLNQNTFDRLPAEGKKFVKETAAEYSDMFNRGWDNQCKSGAEYFAEKGGKVVSWSSEAQKEREWIEAPLWEKWISKTEKKGLPGRKAVDDLYNILKNLGVENPAVGYKPK